MKIKWHLRSYTADEFKEAWLTSNSIAETARKLGLTIYGNTYTVLRNTAKSLELTEEHFRGQAWRKGLTGVTKPHQPIEYYLVEGIKVSSSALKAKIIKAKLLKEECAAPFCPVPNPSIHPFTGESIPLKLSLDHINGNNMDNRLENLRLLCYHCHGETDTWCGKDRKKTRPKISPDAPDGKKVHYCDCGKPRNARAKQCMDCYKASLLCGCGNKKGYKSLTCKPCSNKNPEKSKAQRKITLSVDEILAALAGDETYESLGRLQGVSGSAVRRVLVRADVLPPKSSNKKRNSAAV